MWAWSTAGSARNGGTIYCGDPVYEEGFCRFHNECCLRGEVLPNGQINELLADQDPRRTINFHGIPRDTQVCLDNEPLKGGI